MNRFTASCRIMLVVALVALVAEQAAWAAKSESFLAGGTATAVSFSPNGLQFEFSLSGHSKPGGNFTGTVVGHSNAKFTKQFVTLTLDFGGGNTLTLDSTLEPTADGSLVGPYVITGGTGIYATATGSGTQTVTFTSDTTRGFELEGTLSL
jgi:hypothetical protein